MTLRPRPSNVASGSTALGRDGRGGIIGRRGRHSRRYGNRNHDDDDDDDTMADDAHAMTNYDRHPIGPHGAPLPHHLLPASFDEDDDDDDDGDIVDADRRDDVRVGTNGSSDASASAHPSSSSSSYRMADEDGYVHSPPESAHPPSSGGSGDSPMSNVGSTMRRQRTRRRRRDGGHDRDDGLDRVFDDGYDRGGRGGGGGGGIGGGGGGGRKKDVTPRRVDAVRSLVRAVRRLEETYGISSSTSTSHVSAALTVPPTAPPTPTSTEVVDNDVDGDCENPICEYRWDDDCRKMEGIDDVGVRKVDDRDCVGGLDGAYAVDSCGRSEPGKEGASDEKEESDDEYDEHDDENGEMKWTRTIHRLATIALVDADARAKPRYSTASDARRAIDLYGKSVSPQDTRRVCQYAFKKNDIVWACRTCQFDETCVLCHECFSHSDHEGHDVAFYHASAGGCCDVSASRVSAPRFLIFRARRYIKHLTPAYRCFPCRFFSISAGWPWHAI